MIRLEFIPVIPLLPGILAILEAVFAAIVAFLAAVILWPLLTALSKVGGPVFGWLQQRASDIERWVFSEGGKILSGALPALLSVLGAIVTINRVVDSWVSSVIDGIMRSVEWVVQTYVPAVQRWALGVVQGVRDEVAGIVRAVYAYIDDNLGVVLRLAEAWAAVTVQQAEQFLLGQVRQLGDLESAALRALGIQTAAALASAEAQLEGDITAARAAASAELAAATATVQASIAAAEQDVLGRIFGPTGVVTGLEGELAHGLAGTLAQALAGAAAVTLPLEIAIDDIKKSPCLQNCAPLGALGAALDTIELGAIVALLVAAAKDSHGTAQVVSATLGPVVTDARGLVEGVLGVGHRH